MYIDTYEDHQGISRCASKADLLMRGRWEESTGLATISARSGIPPKTQGGNDYHDAQGVAAQRHEAREAQRRDVDGWISWETR